MISTLTKWWAKGVLVCLGLALGTAHAAATTSEHPITAAALVEVLSKEGAAIAARDIRIPAGVVAREAVPDLVVLSIEPAIGLAGRYWVRLACRNAGGCLSFYASVSSSTPLRCGVRQRASGQLVQPRVPVIRPGDRATLAIHRERSLIQVAVVALESGAIGSNIRVATPDYKQVFHGEVVSSGRLEGVM